MAETTSRRSDLVQLTKARLSVLVVVTTAAGFVSASQQTGQPLDWWLLGHTIFGTLLAAFGAAVFNQVIEVDPDKQMKRTADRPLPSGRMPTVAAFGIGWVLCAFGMVHLGVKVNAAAAWLAGATIAIYIFVYTPLKRRSSWNTIVGAVSGAIPPVIGWAGAGGELLSAGAAWWFALLFFWQLPHFFAINWIHREEYRRAGFVMLANQDDSGARTSVWALVFAIALVAIAGVAPWVELSSCWFLIPGLLSSGALVWLSIGFVRTRQVQSARFLFFATLIYLPVALAALLVL